MDKYKFYRDFCVASIEYGMHDTIENAERRPPFLSKEIISEIVEDNKEEIMRIKSAYDEGKYGFLSRYFKELTGDLTGCADFFRTYYQFFMDEHGYNLFDLLQKRRDKIAKIAESGKIKTDSQFRLIEEYVSDLCQMNGEDEMIERLNALLIDYHQRVAARMEKRKTKK